MSKPTDGDGNPKEQDKEMTDNPGDEEKRKSVKRILAGGGAVLGASALPEKWSKPLIQSAVLPAHADTSMKQTTTMAQTTTTP